MANYTSTHSHLRRLALRTLVVGVLGGEVLKGGGGGAGRGGGGEGGGGGRGGEAGRGGGEVLDLAPTVLDVLPRRTIIISRK